MKMINNTHYFFLNVKMKMGKVLAKLKQFRLQNLLYIWMILGFTYQNSAVASGN